MITSLEFISLLTRIGVKPFAQIPPIFFRKIEDKHEVRLGSAIINGRIGSPYPIFLSEGETVIEGERMQTWQAVFNKSPNADAPCVVLTWGSLHPNSISEILVLAVPPDKVNIHASVVRYDLKTGIREETTASRFREYADEAAAYALDLIATVNSGEKHLIKTIPNKPGKSVHWIESRSRIVLIDNREAAELQHNAGVKLTAEEKEQQTRAAHSRRGHSRLLSAPRYKANVGKRVFVKACWVGPKEWMDTAGQTLYKLIETDSQGG